MSEWITRWEQIDETAYYIVRPINQKGDKLWLGVPVSVDQGWQVKRLREGCYAALSCPPFDKTREQI